MFCFCFVFCETLFVYLYCSHNAAGVGVKGLKQQRRILNLGFKLCSSGAFVIRLNLPRIVAILVLVYLLCLFVLFFLP